MERWREVPGYDGDYEVSDLGRVRSRKRRVPRLLACSPNSFGYPHVILCLDGRRDHWMVHSLVLRTFVGRRPEGMEARHLDGDPANNHLGNLAYGTRSENMQDKIDHGNNHEVAKTHCPSGHPYSRSNTYVSDQGWRSCRSCHRDRERDRRKAAA